ncbi:spore germination protein [Paenibacillus luteus]|uniref:spore germination protein n=1 Tax=Paenibacillus luteus TaxID=2545753 RepID=UPI001142007E|nr:spore germination protein [Paenibacillus luteus]
MTQIDNFDAEKKVHLDEHLLRQWFANTEDVIVLTHMFGKPPASIQAIFIYCSGMTDTRTINDIVFPELTELFELTRFNRREDMQRSASIQWHALTQTDQRLDRRSLSTYVFEGHLVFCLPSLQTIWTIDIANFPNREPNESSTEVSIRGPKDGFVEQVSINIALIRRRLRTDMLACQYFVIGSRTLTKTALLYIEDIADSDMIENIKHKLGAINVEKLISTGQLEELLAPSPITLFPPTDYTGRPDFAVDCLLNGRFVILVDGNPTCIIAPVNLFLLMKSPEDAYFPPMSVNIGRLLRFIGLLTTIFLPGFYIALTAFHTDQVPFPLLATISSGRHGLPMESGLEMFFIMCLMELFREAGVRLPSSIGQTLTVVGGLIIGDAAIRAGMISPLMIVVTAITVVSGSTLVNQVLTSTTILLRFASFFMAAILGMYGFILSMILFVIYLTSIESFGVPYLAPVTPLNVRQLLVSLLKIPFRWNKRRPDYLHTQKPRKDGNSP